MPDPDDKEEGEIEDGEIVESGDEGEAGPDCDSGLGEHNGGSRSMMELLYMEMERKGHSEVMLKKKKRKRRKRKKNVSLSPSSTERGDPMPNDDLNPSKPKKARYVDHDRVSDGNEKPWYKPFPCPPSTGSRVSTMDGQGPGFYQWSPDRMSPDENDPHSKKLREKSPPGLYDSPYESDDGMVDNSGAGSNMFQSVGNFERDGLGGSRQGMNRKNKRRRIRLDKRGGGGHRDGGSNKRRSRPLQAADTQHLICKFFLEGKCVKGDNCNYSHDVSHKKMELCKFYLNGFCSKIESCIYLHNEFPCKFFHTGAQCYSADKCKFSHDVLSDEMRKALDIHLAKDNKPVGSPNRLDGECTIQPRPHRPSLLGSPPQHIKDMVMKKKIPSLFDLEIKPPVYQTGVGVGANPPPPAGPQPQGPLLPTPNEFRTGFRENTGGNLDGHRQPLLPLPTSSFDPDPQDYFNFDQDMRPKFNHMDSGFSNGLQSFNPATNRHFGNDSNAVMDVDDRYPSLSNNLNDTDNVYMPNDFDEDERVNERHPDIDSEHHEMDSKHHDNQPFNPIPWRNLAVSDVDMRSTLKSDDNSDSSCGNAKDFYSASEKSGERTEEPFGTGLDHSSSSDSEDESKKTSKSSNLQVPLHLPKKQRELFMRIQQREAANKVVPETDENKKTEESVTTESGPSNLAVDGTVNDEENKSIKEEEERWYSSSEDDDDDNDQPLAAMLKKLQQQPLSKAASASATTSLTTSTTTTSDSSMFQLSKILQSITSKSTGVTVSSPAVKVDPRRDPRRDPRSNRVAPLSVTPSTKGAETRDPRSKLNRTQSGAPQSQSQPSSFNLSSTTTPSYNEHAPTLSSPRLGERPIVPSSRTLTSSRPSLESIKPKPILSRKRSSTSEEELVEVSHSTSSTTASSSTQPLIPYKLHAMHVSTPNYSGIVHSVNKTVDPKLLLCDPRLKKELANEFSVLNSANEGSSSSSRDKIETSDVNSSSAPAASEASKVKVGQHRLGVATMPAPRIKIPSSHLKRVTPPVTNLLPSLSLLREPPERSLTPPILLSAKLKDSSLFKSEKDSHQVTNDAAKPDREIATISSPSAVFEQPSILSPTAEPMKFDYQPKIEPVDANRKLIIKTECQPEKIEFETIKIKTEINSEKHNTELEPAFEPVKIKTEFVELEFNSQSEPADINSESNTKIESVKIKTEPLVPMMESEPVKIKTEFEPQTVSFTETAQLTQMKFPPVPHIDLDSKLLDSLTNFDDDDDDEKSDSDLVIVEPEVEKTKKVKKPAKKTATSSKSSADDKKKSSGDDKKKSSGDDKKKSSADDKKKSSADDKKSIFMVAQVGDGTCIKIKMIKPTKQPIKNCENNKSETKANPASTKKSKSPPESNSSNAKRATRSNKHSLVPSFEDALNSSNEQTVVKKIKNHQTAKTKQGEKSKTKDVKKKRSVKSENTLQTEESENNGSKVSEM